MPLSKSKPQSYHGTFHAQRQAARCGSSWCDRDRRCAIRAWWWCRSGVHGSDRPAVVGPECETVLPPRCQGCPAQEIESAEATAWRQGVALTFTRVWKRPHVQLLSQDRGTKRRRTRPTSGRARITGHHDGQVWEGHEDPCRPQVVGRREARSIPCYLRYSTR